MFFLGTRRHPKGPDIKRLEHHRIAVSRTVITFSAPANRYDAIQAQPEAAAPNAKGSRARVIESHLRFKPEKE